MSRLIIPLVLLMVASPANAQLFAGAHLGRTFATQHLSNPASTYQDVHGLSAGLSARLEATPWLAVQVEAAFVQKGARWYSLYEMRQDYLEAPITVHLTSPVTMRGVRPYLLGGLAPSVELRCSGYTTPPSMSSYFAPTESNTVPLECLSQRQRYTDRSTVLGGGVAVERGRSRFTLELRRVKGADISGYEYTTLRNDVTTVLVGASRRLR